MAESASMRPTDSKLMPELVSEFPVTERYLVAVSGGRDSVALLHWLVEAGYRKLVVCHLNHRLRGRSSSADARFVERLAAKHGLPFVADSADVQRRARSSKQSVETAARVARYEFFAAVARRRRCPRVFLGHHADDLVETFLMNLFRGAGGGGRVMASVSYQVIGQTTLTVIRPLLHVWRSEIDAYADSTAMRFREDASNAAVDRTRNRMRHVIVPRLEKEFGRSIRKTIWRAAMIAQEENVFLENAIPAAFRELEDLPVSGLRKLPVALQRRVIRRWLSQHEVSDVGFDLIEKARALLDHVRGPARINLPRDRHARRRAGRLFIE